MITLDDDKPIELIAREDLLDAGRQCRLDHQDCALNALGMATRRRSPEDGLIIHADRGVQFTSWAFSPNVRDDGFAPSMGAVGSPYGKAMVEAWGRMQVELLKRSSWKTSIQLATAIHDYIELFRSTRRRYSALGIHAPTEYGSLTHKPNSPADSRTTTPAGRSSIAHSG